MRRTQNTIDRADGFSARLDLALGIIAQLMARLGLTTIVIPSAEVELGPRATITQLKAKIEAAKAALQ